MLRVPEDKSIDLLVTDPALLRLIPDQIPLATARHIHLVSQDASQDHSLLFVSLISQLINEALDALPFHVLLELNCLSSYRLLTFDFTTRCELPLKDILHSLTR